MRIRKSKAYLVIGNAHLGLDLDILESLATLSRKMKANVVHAGNICTYTEKQMYERRIRKLRTFENIGKEKYQKRVEVITRNIQDLESKIDKSHRKLSKQKLESMIRAAKTSLEKLSKKRKNTKESYDHATRQKVLKKKEELAQLQASVDLLVKRDSLLNKLDEIHFAYNNSIKRLREEAEVLAAAERSRIDTLKEFFPNIQMVCNNEQSIGDHEEIIGDYLPISKYLEVHSVNANGDRVTSQPITDRAFRYLKLQRKSIIMPHPSPALRSYEKEGLNNAWNMYTTGGLSYSVDPKRPSEFFKSTHLPSALLVIVDEGNGEYHASRLHFDRVSCPVTKKIKPAILHDGKIYIGSNTIDADPSDCAVYSTDDHAPYEHLGVLAVTRALIRLHNAETFINGGDAGDWSSVCPHNKGKPRAAENLRFLRDKMAFARLLSAQGDAPNLKNRVLIDSNHENWLERFVDEHPALEGIMDQKSVYTEVIPDWEFHIPESGEDYTYYFRDLAIRHGHKESMAKASALFYKYLGGHFHSHNEYLRCGFSGAGCRLGPKYLEGNLTKWQNCSTTITAYKGKAAFDIKSVLHDKTRPVSRFAYRGKIYEVDFHKYK